jgi:hypothetical protein
MEACSRVILASFLAVVVGCGTSKPDSSRDASDAAPPPSDTRDVAVFDADAAARDGGDAPAGPETFVGDGGPSEGEGVDCNGGPVSNPGPTFPAVAANVCFDGTAWCGAAACRNGKIDSCKYNVSNCSSTTTFEQCDGTELGGASCQSLGYAGGLLGCTSWCGFDVRKCTTCVGGDAIIGSCAAAALTSENIPRAVVIATGNDATELGLAWLDGRASDGKLEAHFARLGPDLSVLSEVSGLGSPVEMGEGQYIALAALPQGWVVAIGHVTSTELVTLDGMGKVLGGTRSIADAYALIATSRPGAGPLLVWDEWIHSPDVGQEDPGRRPAESPMLELPSRLMEPWMRAKRESFSAGPHRASRQWPRSSPRTLRQ